VFYTEKLLEKFFIDGEITD
jgi:hypothetical protein